MQGKIKQAIATHRHNSKRKSPVSQIQSLYKEQYATLTNPFCYDTNVPVNLRWVTSFVDTNNLFSTPLNASTPANFSSGERNSNWLFWRYDESRVGFYRSQAGGFVGWSETCRSVWSKATLDEEGDQVRVDNFLDWVCCPHQDTWQHFSWNGHED